MVQEAFASQALGQITRIKRWLEKGLDPNELGAHGQTRLHRAVLENRADVAELLLNYGADPNLKDFHGLSPLRLAHYLGRGDIIPLMDDSDAPWIHYDDPRNGESCLCTDTDFYRHTKIKRLKTLWFSDESHYHHAVKLSGESEIARVQESSKSKNLNTMLDTIVKQCQGGRFDFLSVRWVREEVGFGLFTLRDLEENTFAGEYVGQVVETDPDNATAYSFFYMKSPKNKNTRLLIDASHVGNHTRYINHSSEPNLSPYLVYFEGLLHHVFLTNRKVPAGTQLTYDYGPYYWKNSRVPMVSL